MSEEKSCCYSWEEINKKHTCHHDYYKSLEGKDYCLLHYPAVEAKIGDLQFIAKGRIISKKFYEVGGINLRGSQFGHTVFRGTYDRPIIFDKSYFYSTVRFQNCKFKDEMTFAHSHIVEGGQVIFEDCVFDKHCNFTDIEVHGVLLFVGCEFEGTATFLSAIFYNRVAFIGCTFSDKVYFNHTVFGGSVDFSRTWFLMSADFTFSDFTPAIQESNPSRERCHLEFKNANFSGANLRRFDFIGVDLANACLSGIQYDPKADFYGVNAAYTWGNMKFRRYAMDEAYIRELHENKRSTIRPTKGEKNKPFSFWLYLWRISSDYGRNIKCWIAWSLLFAAGFAGIFYILGEGAFAINTADCQSISLDIGDQSPDTTTSTIQIQQLTGCKGLGFGFLTMLYYSIVTFTSLGFGDVTPLTRLAAFFVVLEVIVGYVMLGGLISILANKLARRAD